MKKNLLVIAAVCLTSAAFAQIPNNSFEAWTTTGNYSDPDNWGTLNSTTNIAGVYTCTQGTPGNPGSFYLKLTSKTVFTTVIPGVAATGTINPVTQSVTGGFPFTTRPANITGSWQYMAMSGTDQGSINVFLSHWNTTTNSRDTVSITQYLLPGMVMSWANFSIPLTYQSATLFPDTCVIILSASNNTPTVNSYLYVDNLAFSGAVGINEQSVSQNKLSVYPNPAASFVTISFTMENPSNVKLQLVDVTGKLVREINPSAMKGENTLTMDLEGVESGIYFLRLVTATSSEVKKISIQ